MCVTDDRHVTYGELWQAFAVPVDSSGDLRLLAVAWLLERAGNGSNSDYQGAAWHVFDHTSFLTSGAEAIYNSITKNLDFDDFPNVMAYIPNDDNRYGWTDGEPQTFIAVMPEPSTLLLIGSGLLVVTNKFRS